MTQDLEPELDIEAAMKWQKPKILLVDIPDPVIVALREEGHNVQAGTFGKPYKVEMNGKYTPLLVDGHLPNFSEQEIVIVDLSVPESTEEPMVELDRSLDQFNWWVKHSEPVVDPRPCLMMSIQDQMDRILSHGGLLVVFSNPRHANEFVWARSGRRGLDVNRDLKYDNWAFSQLFDDINIENDSGEELMVIEEQHLLSEFFRRHVRQMAYSATFSPFHRLSAQSSGYTLFPMVKTKYGATAGGVIFDPERKGWVFILPQCSDRQKEYLLVDLLDNVATEIAPHLFPHLDGGRWTHGLEYEHQSVIDLKKQQDKIRSEAESQIKHLDEQIAAVREQLGYLHGILTKKSDSLVKDVKTALEKLGFAKVIDADEQQDEGAAKQEDLQIHDGSPTLLVEVKGLAGFPGEGDTFQVVKYIPRRMKEWGRIDVSGVVIVNHQCNLPALKRDHDRVFTDQQVQDATHQDVTLVTTWELFRLIRGQQHWDWPQESVRALFYQKGRIAEVPTHYRLVGVVAHYYDQAGVVSIEVDEGEALRVGATVGFALRDHFFQETVESLQVDKVSVEEATGGQRVGHKTSLPRNALPDGTVVYVVRQGSGDTPNGPSCNEAVE